MRKTEKWKSENPKKRKTETQKSAKSKCRKREKIPGGATAFTTASSHDKLAIALTILPSPHIDTRMRALSNAHCLSVLHIFSSNYKSSNIPSRDMREEAMPTFFQPDDAESLSREAPSNDVIQCLRSAVFTGTRLWMTCYSSDNDLETISGRLTLAVRSAAVKLPGTVAATTLWTTNPA